MPQTLDDYVLIDELGAGTTAIVYRAERAGKQVALKVLRKELLAHAKSRQYFHREARALLRLVHPNVVTVHDYSGRDAEAPWIAMELLSGDTLKKRVDATGALPAAVAAAVFAQVAAGLAAAHNDGLVHRDLSLANIFVTESGRVVVADFGLAAGIMGERTSETFVTRSSAAIGTPLYLAPETLRSGRYDRRTDHYALGVALTYCLLGKPPAETSDIARLLGSILDGKLVRASGRGLDATLASLADALTGPDADARPSDVVAQLAAWLQAQNISDVRAPIRVWLGQGAADSSDGAEIALALSEENFARAIALTTKNRYQLGAQLGEGGMARVFRATDTHLRREVAIKLMLTDDDELRVRFHREARAMGRITHPSVVRVLDYSGTLATLPFMVLELVDGMTLDQMLSAGPLSEEAALAIVAVICEAIAAVHEEGFVHRDIKPDNVFLDDSGRVVLGDFGIVRYVGADGTGTFVNRRTQALGSPLFASPEQVFTPDSAGPASDLFSIGSLLQTCVTGAPPIQADGVVDCVAALRDGRFSPLPTSISADVADLIARLHVREPSQRPAARAVVSEVQQLLGKRGVTDARLALRRFYGTSDRDMTSVRNAPAGKTQALARKWPQRLAAVSVACLGLGVAAVLLWPAPPRPVASPSQPPLAPIPEPELPQAPPPALPPPTEAAPASPRVEPKKTVKADEPTQLATIQFITKPWARVTLGGKVLGTTPMFNTVQLAPGSYTVRFDNPAYRPIEKRFVAKSGATLSVEVELERL